LRSKIKEECFGSERSGEVEFLSVCKKVEDGEFEARRYKDLSEKLQNRENWRQQMEEKKSRQTADEFFK
jgi:hypothetical protein